MLGSSIRLFNVGETAIRLHPTFFLLLAWIALVHGMRDGAGAALTGVVFIVLLFACVLLHELGHVVAARRYGIRTPEVTLLPIGGVAALERMPEKPSQEITVALAGPAVNVVIAIVLMVVMGATIDTARLASLDDLRSDLVAQLAAANVALVVFNLIPAFPMDGGRVLRALLATRLGFVAATQVAARIGQAIAVVLGLIGLMGNPLLVLVAVFVFLAASGEAGFIEARDLMRGRLASHGMVTSFVTASPQTTVAEAADLLLRTTQHEFPVVDGHGKPCGAIARETILDALRDRGPETPISEVMSLEMPVVRENACIETVFADLQRRSLRLVGVVDADGRLLGYLTPENITELVMIEAAARRSPGTTPRPDRA
jgi:Zn-dependent protease/CBS domain-containing protein